MKPFEPRLLKNCTPRRIAPTLQLQPHPLPERLWRFHRKNSSFEEMLLKASSTCTCSATAINANADRADERIGAATSQLHLIRFIKKKKKKTRAHESGLVIDTVRGAHREQNAATAPANLCIKFHALSLQWRSCCCIVLITVG